MRHTYVYLLTLFSTFSSIGFANADVLPANEAFIAIASIEEGHLLVEWDIHPGYTLYKDKLSFASEQAELQTPIWPTAEIVDDEYFGEVAVYRGLTDIKIPFTLSDYFSNTLTLTINWQGCADFGFCYPPKLKTLTIDLPNTTNTKQDPELQGNDLFSSLTGQDDQSFLPAKEAFQAVVDVIDPFKMEIRYLIADGYYLYRDKLTFSTDSTAIRLGSPQSPPGKLKNDEYFGETEVYFHEARVIVPLLRATPNAVTATFDAHFQGCADNGICYPPHTHTLSVSLPEALASDQPDVSFDTASSADKPSSTLAGRITTSPIAWVILSFLGLGILLAFTPCILPMVPILSSIIIGQGDRITTRKAVGLSVAYVLAMSLTYTVAGVVVAKLGQNLQATFQHPLLLLGFSALFVIFALAMFDAFTLQMPTPIQNMMQKLSDKQKGGSYVGAAVMGLLSALVVGPCVAAPLAAALVVIGQSGDAVRGGIALFSLSIGMGLPLIVFGASAGKLLPKAGAWMAIVKGIFGFMLFGIAIWMISRLLSPSTTMMLWALLAIATGVYCLKTMKRQPWRGLFAALGVAYGVVLFAGSMVGGISPLKPFSKPKPSLQFERIKSLDDLQNKLDAARKKDQMVMLDFYADWCVACKELEHLTFTDLNVQDLLGNVLLLQADVTANDATDQALMSKFGVFGPPTILFFDPLGREQNDKRVVGFMNAKDFSEHLKTQNVAR